MWRVGSVRLFNPKAVPVRLQDNRFNWVSPVATRISLSVSLSASPISKSNNALTQPQLSLLSSTTAAPPLNIEYHNPPQLALLSLLFVLSMGIGAIFSLATVSIPTIMAFKKLRVSVSELSKTAFEEVPGTLSSLKLSGLEINELTQQLTNLRQKISGTPYNQDKQKQ